ncbi:hypothetical protein LIER_05215 [Lithospermum erythrorhizon]|uniref:Cns1/TTC4 wheel domain-containing protein n=1 Tax=Lithospermum erythrorhizon TaxID=34254 RepID=A0AAV3NZQ0_LITER
MALWMDAGSEALTDKEKADLDAITALKESSAIELKEEGNEFVKKGKKHYSDAIECYTKAINQKALSDREHSIIYSNRAHVNLLLGNFRRALQDAEEAIKLSPENIKAFYRAVKASLSLNLLSEAKSYCEKGLEISPDNDELKKLAKQIDLKKAVQDRREAEVSKAVNAAKALVSAFEDRNLKIGKTMYRELTGLKKPVLDKNNILHWPVLFLYAESMSSDIIEDFCEIDMFSTHLDMISLMHVLISQYIFSKSSPPLPWDAEGSYTRDTVELYYEVGAGVCLSKREIISNLLEGTKASNVENLDFEDNVAAGRLCNSSARAKNMLAGNGPRWMKVNERRTLYDVLKEPNMVIPGLPVFVVVSRKSSFYKEFKSGNWTPPEV